MTIQLVEPSEAMAMVGTKLPPESGLPLIKTDQCIR